MTFAFCCTDIGTAVGPERAHDVLLLGATGGDVAELIRADGSQAWAVDEDLAALAAVDGPLSGAAVLAAPGVAARLAAHGVDAVLPFKPSVAIERWAGEQDLRVLCSPARLARQIENKLQLATIAAEAGVRAPASATLRLDDVDAFAASLAAAGVTFPAVLQPAVGFAGVGTEPVDDLDALLRHARAAAPGTLGKLASRIEGDPLTCTGVAQPGGTVLAGPPARQLTGIASCTSLPMGSCGNEWSLPVERAVACAARDATRAVGAAIAARGFVGTFGVDLVATPDGDVVLIEINPRITASLSLQDQLQRLDGGPTLLDAHLAAFDVLPTDVDPAALASDLDDRFGAGDSTWHAPAAASVIIFPTGGEGPVTPAHARPGIWALDPIAGRAHHVRDAWRYDQLEPGEALVLPASPHRTVGADGRLARLVVRGRVAASERADTLDLQHTALVEGIRRTLVG